MNKEIFKKALDMYDKNYHIYKILKKMDYELIRTKNDIQNNKIIFKDKKNNIVIETTAYLLGYYYNSLKIWIWSWSLMYEQAISQELSKKLLIYGINIKEEYKYENDKDITINSKKNNKNKTNINKTNKNENNNNINYNNNNNNIINYNKINFLITKYIKSILTSNKIKFNNKHQLELHLAISSFLIKKPLILDIYDDNHDNLVQQYWIINDYQKVYDYVNKLKMD